EASARKTGGFIKSVVTLSLSSEADDISRAGVEEEAEVLNKRRNGLSVLLVMNL
ncbi:hypothetical protein BaRGS_00038224, partial [Batillaria attramentaria]